MPGKMGLRNSWGLRRGVVLGCFEVNGKKRCRIGESPRTEISRLTPRLIFKRTEKERWAFAFKDVT